MDRLRQIFEFTVEQLNKLTPTHKMLMGSAAIILLMTLFITSQYAGRSTMVPLGVDNASLSDVVAYLQSRDITYDTAGNDILVPASEHMAVVRALTQNGTLGADAIQNLIDSIQNQAWWQPREQNQQALNAAMSKVLSDIVSGWSYVQRATVIVQSPLRRASLGKPQPRPTASVEVKTRTNSLLDEEQVRAIADFVAGSVPDLLPSDVKIIDARNGRSMRIRDHSDLGGSNYAELRNNMENAYEQKLYDLLRYIPGVIIAVNAQVDTATENVIDREFKQEGEGTVVPLRSEMTNNLEDTSGGGGGVPGVQSNTGASITQSSRSTASGRTSNEATVAFEPKVGSTEKTVHDPKGYATKVRAAISVPRVFYERIWQQQNPDVTDPPADGDAAFQSIVDQENQKITELTLQVIDTSALTQGAASINGVGTGPDDGNGQVAVHMYYDFGTVTAPLGPGGENAEASSGPIPFLNGNSIDASIKTIAVFLLAIVSMFFMVKLIRGAATRRQLPSAEELVGIPPTLEADEQDIIGTAASSEPAMEAIELDDDEMKTRGLATQLEDLVTASPDEAAQLLTKWVTDG